MQWTTSRISGGNPELPTPRLRYEKHPRKGQPNHAPALVFLRKAMHAEGVKVQACPIGSLRLSRGRSNLPEVLNDYHADRRQTEGP
jgi:hypothetical protein